MDNSEIRKSGLLCVVSSPSGGGKTSVIRTILNRHREYKYSISATTRKKRRQEIHGVDYYFLTDKQFDRYVENEEFVEWAHVHSDRYGTLKKSLENLLSDGKIVLLDIDVIGGMNVKKLFPKQALLIFLAPPSMEELQRRLKGRKSETADQIQKRLDRLPMEMSYADKYDVTIINEDFKKTVNQVENTIKKFK